MNEQKKDRRKLTMFYAVLAPPALLVLVISLLFIFYKPDRPLPRIEPASSSEPTYVVQIIRPRLGLPFAGLLPPQMFGNDAHLGFDSKSAGAEIRSVESGRIELAAEDWELVLAFDEDGKVTSKTLVAFELLFEDRRRKVRCRPAEPIIGTLEIVKLEDNTELSGSFDIELAPCNDAETGKSLGWPSKPLILHGSFDRIPIGQVADEL